MTVLDFTLHADESLQKILKPSALPPWGRWIFDSEAYQKDG
jgi:hypothetical protein